MGPTASDERGDVMSFVDLMANDVWSESDIVRRTESMIRAEFSAEAETILNRKVSGMVLGIYTPTEAEQAEMARYQTTVEAARIAGNEARADMALLLRVFPLEEASRRLAALSLVAAWDRLKAPEVVPVAVDGMIENAAAVDLDLAERAAAMAAVTPHVIEGPDGEMALDPIAVETDQAERAAAELVMQGADQDAMALLLARAHA
jgi:hypothetical protein